MEGSGPRKAPVQAHVIVLRYDVQVIVLDKASRKKSLVLEHEKTGFECVNKALERFPARWNTAAQFSEHGSLHAEDRAANTIALRVCQRR
jgi:hypothetical protein